MFEQDEKIKEECGVFGIWDFNSKDVANDIYYGLLAMQHRGQEAAGIAVCDTDGEKGNLCMHKNQGLVTEVFDSDSLAKLVGNIGIGHVRYSTAGGSSINNVQPFAGYYLKGTLALVHNGNIVNADKLKQQLMEEGYVFHATTDTEVIHILLSKMRAKTPDIAEAVKAAASYLIGGYALLIMSPRKIVAVRDPLGLKPMVLGKRENGWVISSETCGLKAIGAEFVRDVEPGEIITISKDGLKSDRSLCQEKKAHCVFEYIYFARLDSRMDGIDIYDARVRGGAALANAYPVDADIVAGVPESGLAAAAGYAERSGIPYKQIFYKNSYLGRTFIKPTQKEREAAVHMKLNVLEAAVRGKRIVLLDDSIVRGTTIRNLINKLREAGAVSVHVRICSPPFLFPCYYGTDVPDYDQLIATKMSIEEIREMIGADSLGYMKIEDLEKMTGDLPLCKSCFNGQYPTPVEDEI